MIFITWIFTMWWKFLVMGIVAIVGGVSLGVLLAFIINWRDWR